jgi:hypothetical protein
VTINVGSPPGHTEALDRIAQTMATAFPVVVQSQVNDFNTVVTGYRDSGTAEGAVARLAAAPAPLTTICQQVGRNEVRIASTSNPLTDDHAPVEWLTDSALVSYLREGAPGAK